MTPTEKIQYTLDYHARARSPDETILYGIAGVPVTLGDLKHALAEAAARSVERTGPRLSAAPDKAPAGQRTPR